jgi:hypothetical protein
MITHCLEVRRLLNKISAMCNVFKISMRNEPLYRWVNGISMNPVSHKLKATVKASMKLGRVFAIT